MKQQDVTDKFKAGLKKKVDTTMIGALCAIEEIFGELWNHGSLNKTSEQSDWYNKYEELRSRILDNGNNQKRRIDENFNDYKVTVEPKTYHYEFVVKPRNTEGN